MMTGIVNSDLEATIRLTVRGTNDRSRRITAVIDTGFDGWLSMPPSLVVELGLIWDRQALATLADGSESLFDVYFGAVVWNRRRCEISIDEADTTPLVGTALLADFELNAQFRPRGKVRISRLLGGRSR